MAFCFYYAKLIVNSCRDIVNIVKYFVMSWQMADTEKTIGGSLYVTTKAWRLKL